MATLDRMAEQIWRTIRAVLPDRQIVLVGESLGGLIALRLGGYPHQGLISGVVAFDPPLVTKKLPQLHNALTVGPVGHPNEAFFVELAKTVFGFDAGKLEDRLYYDLIGQVEAPVLFLTGDEEVFPLRETTKARCVLDTVDRYIIETLFGAKADFQRLEGGSHLLMASHPDWCRDRIISFCETIGVPLATD